MCANLHIFLKQCKHITAKRNLVDTTIQKVYILIQ